MSNSMSGLHQRRWKLLAGTAAAAPPDSAGRPAAAPRPPTRLPPATQEASLPDARRGRTTPAPVPLGPENAREVQNQLIALGFDPGAADGQIGPATMSARRSSTI